MEQPILPPTYYHTNFLFLLSFVQEKYKPLLIGEEWQLLRRFYCLSEEAQCLFVRFCNRRGLYFRTHALVYPEIPSVDAALLELLTKGFARPTPVQIDEVPAVLSLFSKEELKEIFPISGKKGLKKGDYVEAILQTIPAKDLLTALQHYPCIVVEFQERIAFLKFLFFGNRAMDMTEFVLRDLGLQSYAAYHQDDLVARFQTRKEAEDKWRVSDYFEVFYQLTQAKSDPRMVYDWFLTAAEEAQAMEDIARRSFERLALKVGGFLERNRCFDEALEVYSRTDQVPSRERRVRILEKQKDIEAAKALCQWMIDQPINADEHIFAQDRLIQFAQSKKRIKNATTEWLLKSPLVVIPSDFRGQVEQGVALHFISHGWQAVHIENHVWRSLFGLVFWDILFDPRFVAFHHPFQRRPSDLHLPDFYLKRQSDIQARLEALIEPAEVMHDLFGVFQENYGKVNPFVAWVEEMWGLCRVILERVPVEVWKKVLAKMAENPTENSRGFPDLMIWKENQIEWVEVKSPTDHLSNQQLFWQRFFEEIGLKAFVQRVQFENLASNASHNS